MYEQQFGLKSNPFRTAAKGSGVFVGPQQAAVMSRLQKALAGSDNVVTVTGPVGVGKTTVVKRTLETNDKHQWVAWIGRMRLAPDEMLDLLLSGFGVKTKVTGTVRRFALFKRLLAERVAANIRVVIAVEDALRIGTDALLELEALTASEAGNDGANIILMGSAEIEQQLSKPELARLRQRTHIGQSIAPFNAAEVQGYLKHCIRAAGTSFDKLFDEGAAIMLYRCSGGLPRVINNICDAAFSAAAETHSDRISSQLVEDVALDVYGLKPLGEATVIVAAQPTPLAQEDEEPETDGHASRENPTFDDLPTLSHSMRVEIPPIVQPPANLAGQSDTAEADVETEKNHAIPDLDALATAITRANGIAQSKAESHADSTDQDAAAAITMGASEILPELETESEPESEPELEPQPGSSPELSKARAAIPAITLDQTLQDQRKPDPDFNAIAAELATANSLEDISDTMAETLFGIEFQEIAAAAVANPPINDTSPGDSGVFALPVMESAKAAAAPANDPVSMPFDDASPVKLEADEVDPAVVKTAPADNARGEPESIEEQFQTSITQTLQAIDPGSLPDTEAVTEKSGLFGRLKNSFKASPS